MNVKFEGANSAQVAAGQIVTLTVKKPDNTVVDTFTATTLADGSYSVTRPINVAGDFVVYAHQDADTRYTSWDASATFTIGLEPRTGTITVTIL